MKTVTQVENENSDHGAHSSLRASLGRYESAVARADELDAELARAIRDRIAHSSRGEAARIAREFGWSAQRLHAWMSRARRDPIRANRSETDGPVAEDPSRGDR